MNKQPFTALPLASAMLQSLDTLGYNVMTPVQSVSIPLILKRQDLIVQAKTGSGKTAAFGIGLLSHLNVQHFRIQVLVLCPTRELADQVGGEIRRLARFTPNVKVLTLCGGTPIAPQYASLEHGAHIIVGTPGRIHDHLSKGTLSLKDVHTLVLDEADRMLDMGFSETIHEIVRMTSQNRQTLLFSATFPPEIKALSSALQKKPKEVVVESLHDAGVIEQLYYRCERTTKVETLISVLGRHQPESCLIFCNTRQLCNDIAAELNDNGFSALAMHGELEQFDRDETLALFSNKSCSILVATDVAARGLDINDLDAVVNFELPRDPSIYIHRIGRTARAGKKGMAINLVAKNEVYRIGPIEEQQGVKVELLTIEDSGLREPVAAPMVTLCISGGKKNKLRPGDILGALTAEGGITREDVGKIAPFNFFTYVAVKRSLGPVALKIIGEGQIKGKKFRARIVH